MKINVGILSFNQSSTSLINHQSINEGMLSSTWELTTATWGTWPLELGRHNKLYLPTGCPTQGFGSGFGGFAWIRIRFSNFSGSGSGFTNFSGSGSKVEQIFLQTYMLATRYLKKDARFIFEFLRPIWLYSPPGHPHLTGHKLVNSPFKLPWRYMLLKSYLTIIMLSL